MAFLDLALGIILSVFFLTIPGFFVSNAVFSKEKTKKMSLPERGLFSVLFSITVIPFLILIQNSFFNVEIDYVTVTITGLAVMVASYAVSFQKSKNLLGGLFAFKSKA